MASRAEGGPRGKPGQEDDSPYRSWCASTASTRSAHPGPRCRRAAADASTLPVCLRYQFVAADLVLVDSVAGLIVDFLPAAAPILRSRGSRELRAISRLLVVLWLALSPSGSAPVFVDAAPRRGHRDPHAASQGRLRPIPVMGDTGRGSRETNTEVAQQNGRVPQGVPLRFRDHARDNIYGSDTPTEMANQVRNPLQAAPRRRSGVPCEPRQSRQPNQRFYKLFNMGGERYYTFRASKGGISKLTEGGVRFFALDTDYLDEPQIDWLEKELSSSTSDWKISFFHHPLYSSGKTHGSALETRAVLEPLFVKYGVSAAFSGQTTSTSASSPRRAASCTGCPAPGARCARGTSAPRT